MDAVLDEGSIVDRCIWYVNQADLIERQAQQQSSPESVIGKPSNVSLVGPLSIWLRKSFRL